MLSWIVSHMFDKNARPPEVTLSNFLLDFDREGGAAEKEKPRIETSAQREERIKRSKSAWMVWAGLGKDGKPRSKPKPLPAYVVRKTKQVLSRRRKNGP